MRVLRTENLYYVRTHKRIGNLRSTTATVDENVTSKYNLALS